MTCQVFQLFPVDFEHRERLKAACFLGGSRCSRCSRSKRESLERERDAEGRA